MWIFTPFGFFSIVQKTEGDILTVRARYRDDLDRLRERVLPSLGSTLDHAGTDYPYRATVARADLAAAMAKLVQGLDYENFKDEVMAELGLPREQQCMKVWSIMAQPVAEPAHGKKPSPAPAPAPRLEKAYGGVVVNDEGKVLLVEPRNHFDRYVWTWPKGKANAGEAPEAAAIREVGEEGGVEAVIQELIPGVYKGGTSETTYFLMRFMHVSGEPHWETQGVRWATLEEAAGLIALTTNEKGRKRDLAVLEAARRVLEHLRS